MIRSGSVYQICELYSVLCRRFIRDRVAAWGGVNTKVEEAMRKHRILHSIGVAVVLLSASPAWANHEGVPVYRTIMYSDATKTTQVGSIEFQYCTYYAQSDGV